MGDLVYNPGKGIPPHSTGGAIDVSLLDKDGKEINLSEPFKKFYAEPQLVSDKISRKAQELRHLLNKAMLNEGFAPNPKEYWHFSYGDEMWANYYSNQVYFREIQVPSSYYFPIPKRIYLKILRRMWKLLNSIMRIQQNY